MYKNLTNEELCKLLQKAEVNSNEYHKISEVLLTKNHNLIKDTAYKFAHSLPIEDRIQIASLEFFNAALQFNTSSNLKLSTFASTCMHNKLRREELYFSFFRNGSIRQEINIYVNKMKKEENKIPTFEEIVEHFKKSKNFISKETILACLNTFDHISLDQTLKSHMENSDYEELSMLNTIVEDKDEGNDYFELKKKDLKTAIKYLSEDYQYIIKSYYLQGKTLQDITNELKNCTTTRNGQKLQRAKEYLKLFMSDEGIEAINQIEKFISLRKNLKINNDFSLKDLFASNKISNSTLYNILKILNYKMFKNPIVKGLVPDFKNYNFTYLNNCEKEIIKNVLINDKNKVENLLKENNIKNLNSINHKISKFNPEISDYFQSEKFKDGEKE